MATSVTLVIFEEGKGLTEGFAVEANQEETLATVTQKVRARLQDESIVLLAYEAGNKKEMDEGATIRECAAPIFIACRGGADSGEIEKQEPIQVPKVRTATALPIIGNMHEIRNGPHKVAAFNIAEWFTRYKQEVFSLDAPFLAGVDDPETRPVFIADPQIVQQLVDEEDKFPKMWTSKVNQVISFLGGKGLFTSSSTDPEWHTARPLMSKPFNEVKIRQYFDIIENKSQRYVAQLSKIVDSKQAVIDNLNDWNSCFTFDTVMHASLGSDLGNLEALGEKRPLDPFLPAFRKAFAYNLKYNGGLRWFHYLRPIKNSREFKEFHSSVDTMFSRMTALIEQTRNGQIGDGKSVLHSLLFDTSPATDTKVALKNINNQLVTLMVAGHETTAATMGFCMYHLAKNPDCQRKAMEEAREVMGEKGYLDYRDAGKLHYITACLRETLRLYSAVQLLQRESPKDEILKGSHGKEYKVPGGSKLYVVLRALHTRKEDWGDDPLSFNPERFLDESLIQKRHPHSYHPFGFGMRSCVGQFFAIWEARTCLALMLNKFKFEVPKNYKFEPALGLGAAPFPKDLSLRLVHRNDQICADESDRGAKAPSGSISGSPTPPKSVVVPKKEEGTAKAKLAIYYGSNVGACEELAFNMAEQGIQFGVKATVKPLDSIVLDDDQGLSLPEVQHIVVITSTYNGFPPDNAKKFSDWIEKEFESKSKIMAGKGYALCGVGNSQWHATFHKFPKRLEYLFNETGAKAMMASCLVDVSKQWCDDFEDWCTKFWPRLLDSLNIEPKEDLIRKAVLNNSKAGNNLEVEFVPKESKIKTLLEYFQENSSEFLARPLRITKNAELQYNDSPRSTRHIELQLPQEMTYSTGGHIAIRPFAPKSYIEEALALMNLKGDEFVAAGFNNKHAVEPLKKKRAKMQVSQLLKFLDLTVKPSQKTLEDLSELCQCPPEMFKLRHLSSSAGKGEFEESIEQPGVTVLEILSQYKSIVLSIKQFVEFFPLLKVRYYSISSSPLKESGDANQCSITCAKVDYETGTGRRHEGLASGMLSHLKEGDECMGYIHELSSNFHLPTEAKTPIIMIGPGTGIAPFMGFLQERRVLQGRGLDLGEAVLFFGCRSASHDFIYEEELKSFANDGVLSRLLVAFSRDDPEKKVYVQDLIAKEKEMVWRLLNAGAVIYVCGDAQSMAPDVRKAFSKVIAECSSTTQGEADKYLENLQQSNRYLEDVWG